MLVYAFLFISLFFEVFLVITYIETRSEIAKEDALFNGAFKGPFPSVSIIVPCFNEEKTLAATILSILGLDYPKDKLKIIIVDDGSTDNTWAVAQSFEGKNGIEAYKKENGGKYTVLNFALERVTTDLVGCLDADSFVDKNALRIIARYFDDKETMAVTPSIRVHAPENLLQIVQRVEYTWGILLRKMLSYLGALYVTPGPFSIFRREVFENIGPYRHAHNTEDMEIALRMQKNNYKIVNSHRAYVYTVTPKTIKTLYKQRVRWTSGFLKNVLDYKAMLFNKKYGNVGLFILPISLVTTVSSLYFTSLWILNILTTTSKHILKWQTVGIDLDLKALHFDWFFVNTTAAVFVSIALFIATISLIMISRILVDGKPKLSFDLALFLFIYPFIAPLWVARSLFNTVFSITGTWR